MFLTGPDDRTTRRGCLRLIGAGAAAIAASGLVPLLGAAASADVDDDQYDFVIARVKFNCDQNVIDVWNTHPGAERNLLTELTKVVRCKVKMPQGCQDAVPYFGEERHFNAVVDFDNPDKMQKYPFLLMTAEGHFTLNAKEKANLKKYVDEGGFIFMDDCVADMGADYFYQCAHKLLEEIFGPGAVKRIPNTHEVFQNVFDFTSTGLPSISTSAVAHGAQGVWRGDRLAIILSSTDIHCGWVDREHAWYGANGYESAIRFGINMVMYSLAH
jgi:hypothetical protein